MPLDLRGRAAVAPVLAALTRELSPRAAAFLAVDARGEVEAAVVQGSPPDPLAEPVRLRATDTRRVVPLDDGEDRRALVPIRDGDGPVAAVMLWPPPGANAWEGDELGRLEALQPLIELAYLSALSATASIEAQLPDSLTGRQRQVAHLLARGATNPEIARALYISPDTAKSHARAALAKLGLASRRELVMRLSDASANADVAAPDARLRSLQLEGDEAPQPLLAAVLEWSAERLDAPLGGCAMFTARMEPLAQSWGSVGNDARLAAQVHRRVLAPAQPSEIVRYLDADPARSPVVQLDVSGAAPGDEGLGELVARAGLATPLLAVLRRQGRVAGVVWLCREASAGRKGREGARVLRGIHPLLELTHVTRAADSPGRAARRRDLAELGLTRRETAVARLALAGASNATIAARLGISPSTVKKHMTRVLSKCGVRSRTQLIAQLSDPPPSPG